MWISVYVHMHTSLCLCECWKATCRSHFFLLPCGLLGLDSGCQAKWQAYLMSLLDDPSQLLLWFCFKEEAVLWEMKAHQELPLLLFPVYPYSQVNPNSDEWGERSRCALYNDPVSHTILHPAAGLEERPLTSTINTAIESQNTRSTVSTISQSNKASHLIWKMGWEKWLRFLSINLKFKSESSHA